VQQSDGDPHPRRRPSPRIPKAEYIKAWLTEAKIPFASMDKLGIDVVPCYCHDPACSGWMILRRNPQT